MPDLFSIGVSGLVASQAALATTSNNIANATTTGYTRQVDQLSPLQGQETPQGYLGGGVHSIGVERQTSTYLNAAMQTAQSTASEQTGFYTQISQISNMLASSATDLGTSMQTFFSGFQALASDPSSTANRQQVLSNAQTLVDQFQSLGGQLSQIASSVNSSISTDVSQINTYAQQIAALNTSIKSIAQAGNSQAPNDLLDARDTAVNNLSKLVGVSVVSQPDGTENVFIGNGEGLVVGGSVSQLAAVPSTSDPSQTTVAFKASGQTINIPDSQITGGDLGGLLSFRSTSLDPTTQQLGQLATGFTQTVNTQQGLGETLTGTQGQAMFSVPEPQVVANTLNTGSGQLTASFVGTDSKYLQASDYKVAYDGTNYTITRISDGSTGVDGSGATAPATYTAAQVTGGNKVEVDGIQFGLTGAMTAGDSFVVQPAANTLSGIKLALSDPSAVAASGGPVMTTASTGNTGSGALSITGLNGTPSFSTPVTISFSSPTTYTVGTGGAPQTLPANGQIQVNGVTMTLTGSPAANDSFTLANNTLGVGNNQNAAAMGALQTTLILNQGTTSFSGAYSNVVGQVGTLTAQYQATSTNAASVLTDTTNAQQAVSGVNLDEEGANLIKYQNQYEAAAKVIQVASTLFQSILQLN